MARAGLDWSRAELARRAGVSATTIADFENGIRQSYPRTIRDIQNALEVGGANFLDGAVSVGKEAHDA